MKLKKWIIKHLPETKKRAALRKQFRRFARVGLLATVIDFTILNVIVFATGLSPAFANVISITAATSVSYVLNRKWAFSRGEQKSKRRTIVLYAAVTLLGVYGLQSVIVYFVTAYGSQLGETVAAALQQLTDFSLSPDTLLLNIAKLLAVAVSGIWNFVLFRRTVFKAHHQGE